jgi:hypothetical protein
MLSRLIESDRHEFNASFAVEKLHAVKYLYPMFVVTSTDGLGEEETGKFRYVIGQRQV